ncbi:MAG: Na(+)/H(+) antiporter subunit D [bacterium]|nr:Na(+)/H(+) antiporter subunit D [bacterium]
MSEFTFNIPPAFILLAGAILLPFVTKKARAAAFILFPLAALVLIFTLPDGAKLTAKIMNYDLTLLNMNATSRIFGIIFAFIATAGGIYSYHMKELGQQCAALIYAAGALGVTFAGDFFTLFIYWEMMAWASAYLVWARRTKEAQTSGLRYLLYHVLGGGILFAGVLMHIAEAGGNINLVQLVTDGTLTSASSWLILLGVIINAAVPPLHTWLADAYPKATVTGAVFMSALTTKTAVYVLVTLFAGMELLLILGVIMTLYGVVYAVLANDIRGILAYHIISQVGYMVAGVGIGTEMAINGAVAHAFSHILYKALLFMGTGVVLQSTGRSKLTDLGGLYKLQPLTFWLYMVAGFSISGFPLFNGFISKSMTVAAAGAAHHDWALLLMTLAAVGTFLSVGLKLPYFTWLSKDKPPENLEYKKPPVNMHVGMGLVAFFCIFHGIFYKNLFKFLPFQPKSAADPLNWNPFTMHHLVETVQILVFTFVVFWLMRKIIAPKAKLALDLDWIYRKPAVALRRVFVDPWDRTFDWFEGKAYSIAHKLSDMSKNPYLVFKREEVDQTYTPNRYRPPAGKALLAVFIIFIIVVFLGLIF